MMMPNILVTLGLCTGAAPGYPGAASTPSTSQDPSNSVAEVRSSLPTIVSPTTRRYKRPFEDSEATNSMPPGFNTESLDDRPGRPVGPVEQAAPPSTPQNSKNSAAEATPSPRKILTPTSPKAQKYKSLDGDSKTTSRMPPGGNTKNLDDDSCPPIGSAEQAVFSSMLLEEILKSSKKYDHFFQYDSVIKVGYQIASDCGHAVHPAHESYNYEECPRCRVEILIDILKTIHKRIALCGGVMLSAEQLNEHWEINDLVRGPRPKWVNGSRRMANIRPGWRQAKVHLLRYKEELITMAEEERKFNAATPRLPPGVSPPWHEHTAIKAIWTLELAEKEIAYVQGDPVGRYNPDRAKRSVLKRELEEREDREDRRKRRCVEFRINETVTVSGDYIVEEDEVSTVPWEPMKPTWRLPRENTTRPLSDGPPRKQRLWTHKSHLYQPGAWASPEGYEKVDTSFRRTQWEDMYPERPQGAAP